METINNLSNRSLRGRWRDNNENVQLTITQNDYGVLIKNGVTISEGLCRLNYIEQSVFGINYVEIFIGNISYRIMLVDTDGFELTMEQNECINLFKII